MRINSLLLAAGLTTFALFSVMSCDKDAIDAPCPDVTVVTPFSDSSSYNTANINSATRQGDCILLTGQYGGGCVADDLQASAERSALTVYPPVYLVALYDAADDSCQALQTGSASFSLAAIRAEAKQFDLRFKGLDSLVIEVR